MGEAADSLRGLNVDRTAPGRIGFDAKWAEAHPGRLERQGSIEEVMRRWALFISDESVHSALQYTPREDDVIIATHSKAGTTMVQQITHQMRSLGDEDFGEISLVAPFMEIAADVGIDLNGPQAFHPRLFKTHFDWPSVPKVLEDGRLTSKYIYVARDPIAVIISMYNFLLDWFYTAEEFKLCDVVELMLYKRSVPVWDHYAEWFRAAQEHPDKVLWIFYEDLVAQREQCVRQIAQFLGFEGEDAEQRIQVATERSSFQWMKERESLFDEAPSKKARNSVMGAIGNKGTKVRSGNSSTDEVDPLLREEMNTVVWSHFQRLLQVSTYEEFRNLVFASSSNAFHPSTQAQ